MKTEFDINQTVWSINLCKWVTIKVIRIDSNAVIYIDELGIYYRSFNLSTEKPLITQEQFDKVWAEWDLTSHPTFKGSVFELVKECIKEVQE